MSRVTVLAAAVLINSEDKFIVFLIIVSVRFVGFLRILIGLGLVDSKLDIIIGVLRFLPGLLPLAAGLIITSVIIIALSFT